MTPREMLAQRREDNPMVRRKLDIYEFGKRLIETKDLDPVYVLAWETHWWHPEDVHRWLIAYWCFYHVGTASWITDPSDDEEMWERMTTAAGSSDYPRSSERRHFRAKNATESVKYLRELGVKGIRDDIQGAGTTVADLMKTVQRWTGFGPWIAFKVADMVERLDLRAVDFSDTGSWLYDSPREAAKTLWDSEGQPHFVQHPIDARFGSAVGGWAIDRVLYELGEMEAPPRYERKINAQEAETILCKWKSYMNGHYEIGEDITACRKGLLRFAKTPTAQLLLQAGKRGGLW